MPGQSIKVKVHIKVVKFTKIELNSNARTKQNNFIYDTVCIKTLKHKDSYENLKEIPFAVSCLIETYDCLQEMASPQNVTVDTVRTILTEVIEALECPEYASKLDEAKEAAGNEMLKMMQLVFPMVVQIEMETIKHHGFTNSREGIVQFTQLVREMESMDSEVARLHNQIRSHYLPPVSISSSVDTSL